jgi:pimeloyl-ACP methyl ester carboxylesterase
MNPWLIAELPRIVGSLGRHYMSAGTIPPGDGHPVIIYPGFTTGNAAMRPMRKALEKAGHNTMCWDHDRNTGISEALLTKLVLQIDALTEQSGSPVSLIGHSLGGTIARAVSNMRPDAIRRVITVGAPINGIADALHRLRPVYDKLNGTDMIEEHWNQYRDIILKQPTVPCTSIFSKTDGLVRPGMSKILHEPLGTNIIVSGGHFSMIIDPSVIRVVASELVRV